MKTKTRNCLEPEDDMRFGSEQDCCKSDKVVQVIQSGLTLIIFELLL